MDGRTWWVLSLNASVTIVLRVVLRVHTRSVFSAPLLSCCSRRPLLLLLLFSFVARCAPPACLVVFSFIYRYPKLETVVGELCSSRDWIAIHSTKFNSGAAAVNRRFQRYISRSDPFFYYAYHYCGCSLIPFLPWVFKVFCGTFLVLRSVDDGSFRWI